MIIQLLNIVGYVSSIIVIISLITGIALWFLGIFPVLLRLGKGLAKRKIAVFAKSDNLTSLKSLLLDSKLFRSKNIIDISTNNDFGKSENASIYLVFWHDYKDDIDNILSQKKDGTALIIYAPRNKGLIPDDQMEKLDGKRNTAVVNFRGRVLSDIVVSMITTSYKK